MSDSKTALKWIGIGCLVLAIVACCVASSCAGLIYQATSAPAEAAHAFLRDVRTGNDATALARMSGSYQSTHDLATFSASVSTVPSLRAHTDATLASRNIENSYATISGSLTTATGEIPVQIRLSSVSGSWYVDNVMVQGIALP